MEGEEGEEVLQGLTFFAGGRVEVGYVDLKVSACMRRHYD